MAETITPKELQEKLKKVLVIDVRESDEISYGTVPTAQHIPFGKLIRDERKGIVPKDKEIVCYCAGGFRGNMAADFLNSRGYKAKNLAGGFIAWTEAEMS